MVHQPSGGFQGQATDVEIHAREILTLRARLNQIYVKHSGKDIGVIEESMERDRFLSPEDAKEFGLIDEVVDRRLVLEHEGLVRVRDHNVDDGQCLDNDALDR